MLVHTRFKTLCPVHPVVTTGVFDGVHLGHRALLDHLVRCARLCGGESVVITFDPPPRLALAEDKTGICFLTSPEEKKRLLEESGIDHLLILNFTRNLGNMNAYDFVKEILVNKIATEQLIVGHDHHFGKMQEGNYDSVRKWAEEFHFSAEQIGETATADGVISSTAIRDALRTGDPEKANRMLGYSYSINGTVTRGKGIGRSLGFPTANIKPDYRYKLIPATGVYAVMAEIGGSLFNGIMSIGYNPTVNRKLLKRSIEVNIFDFNEDIYGSEIKIFLKYWLREEKRFDSTDDLSRRMELDKQLAVKLLA